MTRIAPALAGAAIGLSLGLGGSEAPGTNAEKPDSPPVILAAGQGTPAPQKTPKYVIMNFGGMKKEKK
jgi:hypothetical protein